MSKKHNADLEEGESVLLRSFFPKAKELTIKEIMKQSSYSSYERNNSYLRSLAKKKIIQEKKIGKTLVYSLIPQNWFSKKAFHEYALNKARLFSEKHKTVASAFKELPVEEGDFYVIFGSYAKGTERKESDIDLLCVTSYKEKMETSLASLKRRYNIKIHPIIISKTEFVKIKRENPEFWQDLIYYGIIFKGYELFYYYAYET